MSFFSIKTASKFSSSTSKGVWTCIIALGPRGLGDPPLSLWKGLRRGHLAPKLWNGCWMLVCRQPKHTNELWLPKIRALVWVPRSVWTQDSCAGHKPQCQWSWKGTKVRRGLSWNSYDFICRPKCLNYTHILLWCCKSSTGFNSFCSTYFHFRATVAMLFWLFPFCPVFDLCVL